VTAGDLIKHYTDNNSFGVIMSVDTSDIKVLWLDEDHPAIEWYPAEELIVTSSAGLD
jgi:hypothetical protein